MACLSLTMVLLLQPKLASAQECFGIPVPPGRLTLELNSEQGRSSRSYGGLLSAAPVARLTVAAGYHLLVSDTLHNEGSQISGRLAASLSRGIFSVCPFVGVERASYTEPVVALDSLGVVLGLTHRGASRVRVPVGLAVSGSLRLGNSWRLIPFASTAATGIWERPLVPSVAVEPPYRVFRSAGVMASFDAIYGRFTWSHLDGDRAEPKYTISVGVGI